MCKLQGKKCEEYYSVRICVFIVAKSFFKLRVYYRDNLNN